MIVRIENISLSGSMTVIMNKAPIVGEILSFEDYIMEVEKVTSFLSHTLIIVRAKKVTQILTSQITEISDEW